MRFERKRDHGRGAAALLASAIVFVGGMLVCANIVFTFSSDPTYPLLICAAVLVSMGLLLWLLRSRPRNESLKRNFFWLSRQKPEPYVPEYRPRKKKRSRQEPIGTNQPPTAESVQNLANGVNNWVPSGKTPKSKPKHRDS